MLKAKGTHHNAHAVLGGAFAEELRYLGLQLGRGQIGGVDDVGRFLPQWTQQLALIGNVLQQGIALTQGVTTAGFLVTPHQSLVGGVKKEQLIFLAAGLHFVQNLQ